jgi:Lar family restriction alleviation protein
MTDALLPCPFCGCCDVRLQKHSNAGRGEHSGDDVFSIGCYRCGASVPNRYNEHGRKLLIAAWNTRADIAQARVEGFQERISELVALLDQQLGTPCEAIRHAQEIEESQARIAEFKVTLEWYAAHVADCRKLGRDGDVARGKLDRDGGTKAREALKVTS